MKNLIKLAEQGNAEAQFELAYKYYSGTDVAISYTDAVFWFKKAAIQGHSTAQYNIAQCYEKAIGVEQDYVAAFYWYGKAAEQGDRKSVV